MPNALVATSTIQLAADSPVVTIPVVVPPISLAVTTTDLTGVGKEVAVDSDMQSQAPVAVGYTNGNYTVPGTLTWDGKLLDATIATKLTKGGVGAVLDTAGGTIVWEVTVPAVDPGPPKDDPATEYDGTWEITLNPNDKLTASD